MSTQQIKEQVIEILTGLDEEENVKDVLTHSDDLLRLGINSIVFIKVIVELENRFEIEFEDDLLDYTKFSSLKLLCDYVEKRIQFRDK